MMSKQFSPVASREEWTAAHRLRDRLVKAFPACFAGKGKPKQPLKIGIDKDVLTAIDVDPRNLSLALHDYTGGHTYLDNMVAGAVRVGLDGSACGVVTDFQARQAAGRLARRNAKDAERRKRQAAVDAVKDGGVIALALIAVFLITFLGSIQWAHAEMTAPCVATMEGVQAAFATGAIVGVLATCTAVVVMTVLRAVDGRRQ